MDPEANVAALDSLSVRDGYSEQITDYISLGNPEQINSEAANQSNEDQQMSPEVEVVDVEKEEEKEEKEGERDDLETCSDMKSPEQIGSNRSNEDPQMSPEVEEEIEVVDVEKEEEKEEKGGVRVDLETCSDMTSSDSILLNQPLQEQRKYALGTSLKLLCSSSKEFDNANFLRGCKWAPDGSCLLTCSNDNKMRLYNLPSESYTAVVEGLPEMFPVLRVPQGDSVYDFCWYPLMTSWSPDTCCFITCCKDHPVHLWDAYDAHQRTAYVPYNHLDEVTSPNSIAFSLDGSRIYCGFCKQVKVFHTNRPGRECETRIIYEKKFGGQTGIISCIVMHPEDFSVYALGSYSCSIGLYSETMESPAMLLSEVGGGVTHMQFSPDGTLLYSGFRKNGVIKCWDLRNPDRTLYTMEREVSTNQTIFFDLFSGGRYLITGNTNGKISGWDLQQQRMETTCLHACLEVDVHGDAVNGCSIHPRLPLLATSSGQRLFPVPYSEEALDWESTSSDNSVKLWSLLGENYVGNYTDHYIQ